jgi:ribosomal protein S12 methylthiotransferase
MLAHLVEAGFLIAAEPERADVVVINTCGFIEPARQESLAVIREMLDLKRQGRVGAVVVAGCLAERRKEQLLEDVPEVDHVVGVFGREEISQVVDHVGRHVNRHQGVDGKRQPIRQNVARYVPGLGHELIR